MTVLLVKIINILISHVQAPQNMVVGTAPLDTEADKGLAPLRKLGGRLPGSPGNDHGKMI